MSLKRENICLKGNPTLFISSELAENYISEDCFELVIEEQCCFDNYLNATQFAPVVCA